MKPTVLLIGLGDLGNVILEFLVREEELGRIVCCDLNKERGIERCNLARLSALAHGYTPSLSFAPLDINDKEAVIEVVKKEKPEIILNAASLQTWRLPDLLPSEQAALIKSAGFGIWLPVHVTLTLKLMEALHAIDYKGVTITAPFPDVVNFILNRLHLAPTCGVGNLDEIVPKVRLLAARRLGVSVEKVRVLLVAHHALEPIAFGEPADEIPPYFLYIEHEGKNVTEEVRGDELLLAPYPLPPGPAIHFLTAASAARLIRALISEKEILMHAPGPKGLPGGYPIVVSNKDVRVAPIEGLTIEEAIAINERSHRFDGIESIETDGTVVFCPEAVEIFRDALGYDCSRLNPGESEERAKELIARFREYAGRFGVNF
jgi:hypothetical protein